MQAELYALDAFAGNFNEVNRNYISPDLSTLTVTIAHSQIIVTLTAARRFPAGFDDAATLPAASLANVPSHIGRHYRLIAQLDPMLP